MDNLLTIKECACRLKVSTVTIRRLISNNQFCEIRKIGGQIRVKENDLEFWVDTRQTEKQKYIKKKTDKMLGSISKMIHSGV